MAETTPRGIQATLLDYFQATEYFTIQVRDTHKCMVSVLLRNTFNGILLYKILFCGGH